VFQMQLPRAARGSGMPSALCRLSHSGHLPSSYVIHMPQSETCHVSATCCHSVSGEWSPYHSSAEPPTDYSILHGAESLGS
jgi:hypothetical protein